MAGSSIFLLVRFSGWLYLTPFSIGLVTCSWFRERRCVLVALTGSSS
jgi:hypothetical protein